VRRKQLWQVEQIAAQQQMVAALQELLAAATQLDDTAAGMAVQSIEFMMGADAARSYLLQHELPALLASLQTGSPSTEKRGVWLLLSSFAAVAEGAEAIAHQDWRFLIDVMLGQRQITSELEAAAAAVADAATPALSSRVVAAEAVALQALREQNAVSAAFVLECLARDAGLPMMATSADVQLLLLGVLPPGARRLAAGSSSSASNSSASSDAGSSNHTSQIASGSQGNAAVWSEDVAKWNCLTCRHAMMPAWQRYKSMLVCCWQLLSIQMLRTLSSWQQGCYAR
jgi:hypothetical protein